MKLAKKNENSCDEVSETGGNRLFLWGGLLPTHSAAQHKIKGGFYFIFPAGSTWIHRRIREPKNQSTVA